MLERAKIRLLIRAAQNRSCALRSLTKKARTWLAADKRRLTPIESNEVKFVLSAFIRVHRRLDVFFHRLTKLPFSMEST
jgi:hypothetical protein